MWRACLVVVVVWFIVLPCVLCGELAVFLVSGLCVWFQRGGGFDLFWILFLSLDSRFLFRFGGGIFDRCSTS